MKSSSNSKIWLKYTLISYFIKNNTVQDSVFNVKNKFMVTGEVVGQTGGLTYKHYTHKIDNK